MVKGLSHRREFYLGQRYGKIDFNSVRERTFWKSGLPLYQRDLGNHTQRGFPQKNSWTYPITALILAAQEPCCPTHAPVPFLKEQAPGVTKMCGVFLIYVIMPILQMRRADTQLRMFTVSYLKSV